MTKKILTIFFIFNLVFTFSSITVIANTMIEDEILQHNSLKNVNPHEYKISSPITDELIVPKASDGSLFQLEVSKKGTYERIPITDDMLSQAHISRSKQMRKIKAKNKYDFTKRQIPIHIKIADKLTSKGSSLEGDTIPFVSLDNFEINGKKYSKGTTIYGRLESISESDKMGVPFNIKIDNFYIDDKEKIDLYGAITKAGANRSIWVYPLYQAGNIMFYIAGFVFVPIHGGHAKISTKEIYTIFYETK